MIDVFFFLIVLLFLLSVFDTVGQVGLEAEDNRLGTILSP